MRLMVHKESKLTLALLFNPIEWMTNENNGQNWLQQVTTVPGFLGQNSPGVLKVEAGPHGPNQTILLTFDTQENLKAWVEDRMIPVMEQEEYDRIRTARGLEQAALAR